MERADRTHSTAARGSRASANLQQRAVISAPQGRFASLQASPRALAQGRRFAAVFGAPPQAKAAPEVAQRNAHAAQNYVPANVNQVVDVGFRDNHMPQQVDLQSAWAVHDLRGAIRHSTIVAITQQDLFAELQGYLLGLSDLQSHALVNQPNFNFVTAQSYQFIQTTIGEDGERERWRLDRKPLALRVQWVNGYYQIYHFSHVVG